MPKNCAGWRPKVAFKFIKDNFPGETMKSHSEKKTILIVDDAPENIDLLNIILCGDYKIKVALTGEKALEIASDATCLPDLILLDVMMPGMDGYEVCRQLKTSELTRKIPIIFVSALSEPTDESKGFEFGAVDYLTKPVNAPIVRARVRTHLALNDQNKALEEKVRIRTDELAHTQDVTIIGFATLAEFRNQETGSHIMRTQQYVRILAQYLMIHSRFSAYLNTDTINLLYKSAPLHDIGKIAVPDRVLLKPGKLTPDEFEEIKLHTVYGRDAILRAEQALGDVRSTFLSIAKEIAYTHHEKWDGSGYPQGLAGDDIPISGRLMALADVYDALTSKRVYKAAFAHEKAVEIIREERGKQFDPEIVDAFLDIEDVFRNIAQNIIDPIFQYAPIS
jgi:putative two-component system response regulator